MENLSSILTKISEWGMSLSHGISKAVPGKATKKSYKDVETIEDTFYNREDSSQYSNKQ